MSITASLEALSSFWQDIRASIPSLPAEVPEAWAFGATPAHADGLLDLVLSGVKTGTASSVWDYEASGDPMPEVGDLSIILDGRGTPRAVIRTTSLRTVPFSEVDEEHAHAEGEGDRTLAAWREIHERFWRNHSEDPRGWAPDMPVLCERFELVHPAR
ncbi:ASCH domain-containing protein [Microbacterium sp. YJN-G]|uniref:ASCH domain-containing protein n=1 Tax=Microbacterium sp. YJN-G TaxID=2763257 RepID=UPI0018779F18|nr:ASCH domain-containing protein [Microbacterium sp. YJN-G]